MDEKQTNYQTKVIYFCPLLHESVLIAIMEPVHWIEKFFPYRSHAIFFIYRSLALNFVESLIRVFRNNYCKKNIAKIKTLENKSSRNLRRN